MANFIIIDKADKLYEYTDKDGLDKALEAHATWLRGICVPARFTASVVTWSQKFNNKLTSTSDKIELFNALCAKEKYGIKRIITEYTDTYDNTH